MLPRAVSDHYRAQQRLTLALLSALRSEWATVGDDLDAGWRRIGPRLTALVTAAQLGAATDGLSYVPQALLQSGHDIAPIGQVDPKAFAGVATSLDALAYGDLGALLYGAVVHARSASASTLAERKSIGMLHLATLARTQISDAARQSASVAIIARPRTGWIRMVSAPCCQRCAVLAGKLFKSNQGFDRHPRCDCRHIPFAESDPFDPGVRIGPEDVKDLTSTQRQAIADGADMNQVINARRSGAISADGMWTNEGMTRRGWASHVRREIARQRGETLHETATQVGRRGFVQDSVGRRFKRPTPEAIYRFTDSREEAIQLLRDYGYFV